MGFEYELRYTTDYRIRSRTRLTGFDSVWLGEDADVRFELANRFEDRREALRPSFQYRIVVFDHTEGNRWTLRCTTDGAETTLADFTTRSTLFTTPQGTTLVNARLYRNVSGVYVPYTEDWALYDGYIGETGRTEVQITVRTSPESVTPTAPKYFRQISFYGAEEGMNFTISRRCRLHPCFSSAPGYGSAITFADVARHRIRQSELLEALQHLFNLRFHTEQATRTVRIEPADDFFAAGPAADWRAKTDFSQPVVLADIAPEVHERRTWRYLAGDGAVARFDAEAESPFGQWSVTTDSRAAKEGEKTLANPLFSPTISTAGGYSDAPSAVIMQVGDRDDAQEDGTNFTPRIGRFAGMHPLPGGERWGFPSGQAQYPLAAFHFAGDGAAEGFTLCFEDRDGVRGLHRYYDLQTGRDSAGRRITLSLRLAPHEFESLFTPGTGAPDLRSAFLLDTGEGTVRAALRAVEDYDPQAASVRCTFTQLPDA